MDFPSARTILVTARNARKISKGARLLVLAKVFYVLECSICRFFFIYVAKTHKAKRRNFELSVILMLSVMGWSLLTKSDI